MCHSNLTGSFHIIFYLNCYPVSCYDGCAIILLRRGGFVKNELRTKCDSSQGSRGFESETDTVVCRAQSRDQNEDIALFWECLNHIIL